MSREVVDESELVAIYWEPDVEAVHVQWRGPVGGERFRDALDLGLATLRDRGGVRWMDDMRRLGMITRADQLWMDGVWYPKAIDVGMRWLARVNPESSKTQVSIRELMQRAHFQAYLESELLFTHAFDTVDEARGWLRQVGA